LIRQGAKQKAVSACIQAGIIPVMITGDHELTAKAIAKQLGIITSGKDLILSGTKWQHYQKRVFRYSGTCAFMRVSTLNKN
jgi:Ca2+-transporting ATPase